MKNHVYILAVIYLCMMSQSASPELLIVKKVGNVFAQLSKEDVVQSGKTISEILLKYQWPMCIMSELDPDEEQTALLSPNKPHAEEIFIENKIKASDSKFKTFRVIFVPTTLYELFCIVRLLTTLNDKPENSFVKAIGEVLKNNLFIDLYKILNTDGSADQIREKVYDQYKKANNPFFNQNAFLDINNTFVNMLFTRYSKFKDIGETSVLADAIKDKSGDLTSFLIGKLWEAVESLGEKPWLENLPTDTCKKSVNIIATTLHEKEMTQKIVPKVIALEYEARELNKALLIRGAHFRRYQVGFKEKAYLAGNTLKEDEKGIIQPYSVAFGNSLFAGVFLDRGACAYSYLAGSPNLFEIRPYILSLRNWDTASLTGYAILIDKKAYYQDQCSNLFLIAPLAPIAAIFQWGEFFHSRTKAAISSKTGPITVSGLKPLSCTMTDPTGVILIERDPLEHAELFSTLLAECGRMIPLKVVSEAIKKAVEDEVRLSQSKAAAFYKSLRLKTRASQPVQAALIKLKKALSDLKSKLGQLSQKLKTLKESL